MSQIYNENTKVPKPKENQVGILGISSRNLWILLEIQQRASSSGESTAGITYLPLRIHPKVAASPPQKLTRLYLVVQGKAQLEHS